MTKRQAKEWVHHQLIVVEMGHDEVVAAFIALAERSPGTTDRLKGLFRMCCEIVTSSEPAWDESRAPAENAGHDPHDGLRRRPPVVDTGETGFGRNQGAKYPHGQ